jgi:hypothetical protein
MTVVYVGLITVLRATVKRSPRLAADEVRLSTDD